MPPGIDSRHILVPGVTRIDDGLTFLLDREPFRFVNHPDNRRVVAGTSDSWHSLAAEHLAPLRNAEQYWWVIADFQPDPVVDPTIPPVPGATVYIPSPEFVQAVILSRERRGDSEI